MDLREFGKTDLNLLISLKVLLEERSVSRAAERLFITQPAMSKTLTRLRDLFEDPLFTRSGRGMQPTPRALELAAPLESILGDISELLSDAPFTPATFQGEVTLALSEYLGVALLPQLMATLSREAPQLSITIITRVENQLEALSQGAIDLSIHIEQENYDSDYRVQRLGASPMAILLRESHPLVNTELSLEALGQFPLIRLYISDWEQLELRRQAEALLGAANHHRSVLEISHLLTALEVLRHTDYIMPAPAFVLQNEQATAGIIGRPAPQRANLSINYALVMHRRTTNSGLHNWLWEKIAGTIPKLDTPLDRKFDQGGPAGNAVPVKAKGKAKAKAGD